MEGAENLMNAASIIKKVKINRSTLWRWVQQGKVKPLLLGGAKIYDLNEIKRLKSTRRKGKA